MTTLATPAPATVAVPLLDLKPQYQAIKAEIEPVVCKVMESQMFILGPEVEAFEREIAEYCGMKHAIGCTSGSDALLLALMAIGAKLQPVPEAHRRGGRQVPPSQGDHAGAPLRPVG